MKNLGDFLVMWLIIFCWALPILAKPFSQWVNRIGHKPKYPTLKKPPNFLIWVAMLEIDEECGITDDDLITPLQVERQTKYGAECWSSAPLPREGPTNGSR